MSPSIKIFDTTLRDGEQSPGCSMTLNEKREAARQLERLKVDVIEAGFAAASPGDFESVRAVAEEIRTCTVAALARAHRKDIEAAGKALEKAAHPRIHTFIATSPIHMRHKLKMEPRRVLEITADMVKFARSLCAEVEFSAEDATRTDPQFLCRVAETAVRAGARVINIPDTVGYASPEEYAALITMLRENVPLLDGVDISVHCHNDLGLAVANTLAAARAGATQLECTVNGIGERAGNAAMEEIVMALHTRKDLFGLHCGVNTRQIHRTSRLVSSLIGVPVPPNKAVVGANAFAHEAGIHQHGVLSERTTYEIMTPDSIGLKQNRLVLGKHSGRHAFEDRLRRMGYDPEKARLDKLFARFKELADKKKSITDRDLEALIHSGYSGNNGMFHLDRFNIHSSHLQASADITLTCGDRTLQAQSVGDGTMDAAFKALEKMVDGSFSLEDFFIHAVTEGRDAQGEVRVKLRHDGETAIGKGLSTDVVEAGILAYIHAVNRLTHSGGPAPVE